MSAVHPSISEAAGITAVADNVEKPRVLTLSAWASMKPTVSYRDVRKKVGTKKVTKRKGLFFKVDKEVEEPVYETSQEAVVDSRSVTHVDLDDLARKTQHLCNRLESDGYEVLLITPVASGRFKTEARHSWVSRNQLNPYRKLGTEVGYGVSQSYGYGYSVTDGVMVTGRLRGGSNS